MEQEHPGKSFCIGQKKLILNISFFHKAGGDVEGDGSVKEGGKLSILTFHAHASEKIVSVGLRVAASGERGHSQRSREHNYVYHKIIMIVSIQSILVSTS